MLCASTLYDVLGVPGGASSAEIKRAFHKLALRLHPDKSKEELAEEAFKRVEEAHRTLSDGRERRVYDLGGHGCDDDARARPRRRAPRTSEWQYG